MRLVSYQSSDGPRLAASRGDEYVDLVQADPSIPATMNAFLAGGPALVDRAMNAAQIGRGIACQSVRLLAPVPAPQKIFCVGLNYADHARETGKEAPAEPVIFNKLATALCAHNDEIVLPKLSRE